MPWWVGSSAQWRVVWPQALDGLWASWSPRTRRACLCLRLGCCHRQLVAGSMDAKGRRRHWWIPLTVLFVIAYLLYAGRAVVQNGVGLWPAIGATFD